jgi:hypothetical protein
MNVKCIFRTSRDSIDEYINKNKGLVIIYGATFWAGQLVDYRDMEVDYFCDKKASIPYVFHGIEVVDVGELERRIADDGKRATIIICVGMNKYSVNSIFKDLVKLDIDADVFDYFENAFVFCDKEFFFKKKKYNLFEHSYNCGYINARMTERSIELALAQEYINGCDGGIIEIGAVTPYYFENNKIDEIVDPTDIHKAVTKKSLFDCDLNGKNVLSISTVEHIGTSDYGMNEEQNVLDAVNKIITEANTYMITAPMGYNQLLDKWVKENFENCDIRVLRRHINNHWEEVENGYVDIEYTKLWADGLIVINKE